MPAYRVGIVGAVGLHIFASRQATTPLLLCHNKEQTRHKRTTTNSSLLLSRSATAHSHPQPHRRVQSPFHWREVLKVPPLYHGPIKAILPSKFITIAWWCLPPSHTVPSVCSNHANSNFRTPAWSNLASPDTLLCGIITSNRVR
jgi:hypothetical protein